eukprot:jgi/Bigna1/78582/fgenesh1_pg.55_\
MASTTTPMPDRKQHLEDYPLLYEAINNNMTSKQLKAKGNKSFQASPAKDDLIMALLLTAAKRSEDDKLEFADTTKLMKLLTSGAKKSMTFEAREEWADFVYSAYYRDDDEGGNFEISKECCPQLYGAIDANMTKKAITEKANKSESPPSGTKGDFVVALIKTAAYRAANHISDLERKGKRFNYGPMKELRALLNKDAEDAVDKLLGDEETEMSTRGQGVNHQKLHEFNLFGHIEME